MCDTCTIKYIHNHVVIRLQSDIAASESQVRTLKQWLQVTLTLSANQDNMFLRQLALWYRCMLKLPLT